MKNVAKDAKRKKYADRERDKICVGWCFKNLPLSLETETENDANKRAKSVCWFCCLAERRGAQSAASAADHGFFLTCVSLWSNNTTSYTAAKRVPDLQSMQRAGRWSFDLPPSKSGGKLADAANRGLKKLFSEDG